MLGFHTIGRQALGATTSEAFAAATAPTYTANLVLSGTGFSVALAGTLTGPIPTTTTVEVTYEPDALGAFVLGAGANDTTTTYSEADPTSSASDQMSGTGFRLTLDTELSTQVA